MSEEQDREAMIAFWRWEGKMDEPMTPAALEKYQRDWARMMESKERRRKEREKPAEAPVAEDPVTLAEEEGRWFLTEADAERYRQEQQKSP